MNRLYIAAACAALALPAPAYAAPVQPVLLFDRVLLGNVAMVGNFIDGGQDVNSDGVPDLLVGTANQTTGRVTLISGANASTIATLDGKSTASFFGHSVRYVGDIDGDGVSDFVAAAWGEEASYAYSGATRQRLLSRSSLPYGGVIVPLGDADGDGTPDFLVTVLNSGPPNLLAIAYSGKTGLAIYQVTDPVDARVAVWGASALGDIDGDGVSDVILGDYYAHDKDGIVRTVSGKTGAILRTYVGARFQRLGTWVHGVLDVTGDGVPDYVIDGDLYSGATGTIVRGLGGIAIGLGQVDGAGGNDIAILTGNKIDLWDQVASARLATIENFANDNIDVNDFAPIGDIDGDGTTDFAIAGTRIDTGDVDGRLWVFRNIRGTLDAATVDLLPGKCPNALASRGGGAVELAVLGNGGGDVSKIDLSSVRLAGVPASSWTQLKDVGTTGTGGSCNCPSSANDGTKDLIVRFDADALRAALVAAPGDLRSLAFSAKGSDGIAWSGSDCVTTTGRTSAPAAIGSSETALRCIGSSVIAPGEALSLSYPAPSDGGAVRITVFDLAGRRVAELPDGGGAGVRSTQWNGRDAQGAQARRGVYFVQARAGTDTGKSVMVIVR